MAVTRQLIELSKIRKAWAEAARHRETISQKCTNRFRVWALPVYHSSIRQIQQLQITNSLEKSRNLGQVNSEHRNHHLNTYIHT